PFRLIGHGRRRIDGCGRIGEAVMSSPVRSKDSADDPLMYAPPWVRACDATVRDATRLASPPMAPGIGGFNIEPPPPHTPRFEGDRDIIEFKRRLSLEPELVPPPPSVQRRRRPFPVGWLMLAIGLAATVAYGIALLPASRSGSRPQAGGDVASGSAGRANPAASLFVERRQAYANEPLPLQFALNGTSGQESVIVSGLISGTRLSAGNPLGAANWLLSPSDIGKVLAYPPKDFVGLMNASIDLRSPLNKLLDSRTVRLEWLAQPDRAPDAGPRGQKEAGPPATSEKGDRFAAEEIAMLLRRSHDLLKSGDIAAA